MCKSTVYPHEYCSLVDLKNYVSGAYLRLWRVTSWAGVQWMLDTAFADLEKKY